MIKDEKIIIAWRTLMEVMKVTGNIMFYDIEIRTIVDALNELQKLRDNRDKAIEYLNEPNRDGFDFSKARLIQILESEDKDEVNKLF